MANLAILRTYALREPTSLPKSILYTHTRSALVIFDAYPKSIFHFLVLPRVQHPLTTEDLTNLRTLAQKDMELAKEVFQELKSVAESLRQDIEAEMIRHFGFKWGIWIGIHGAPSMLHLHLHVLSADLCSEKMKNKKHYNSFHPKLRFFLDIDTVISWFDATPSFRTSVMGRSQTMYDKMLKEPLSCFRCGQPMKNMPILKQHLQEEWEMAKQKELKGQKSSDTKQLVEASSSQEVGTDVC
ncbi:hypothetical protein APHAL10511_001227 [Amanita phalloides]|nr:hypothetical protein APHAL10511_001227 [Amanita phalloides]